MTNLLKARFLFFGFQTVNQSPGVSKCYFGLAVYISRCDVGRSGSSSEEEGDKEKVPFC